MPAPALQCVLIVPLGASALACNMSSIVVRLALNTWSIERSIVDVTMLSESVMFLDNTLV